MPDSTPPDSREFRYKVVQGYDRRPELHPDVVRSIRWYISTGDPAHLQATTYDHRRKILLKEQRGK